jgi:hypothetical protein
MVKQSKVYEEVDRILWEDWDPIGVNELGGPDDEYRGYVPSIVKRLLNGGDEHNVSKLLHQHANGSMGLSTKIEYHKQTARKLLACVENLSRKR